MRTKVTLPPYEQAQVLASEMPREDQERLITYLKFLLQQSKPKADKKKPEDSKPS